jgi:Transcriptional regulatory protein, C terminal
MTVGVLGPVAAWGADGAPLDLKGPRHRAVLARLAVARGRVVPLSVLIEDLWEMPPAGAAGAIRTFVGALRRAIEPGRPPRTGFQTLITQGPGYALRTGPDDLDALRFERLAAEPPSPSTTAPAPPEHTTRCCPQRQRSPEQPAPCSPPTPSATTSPNCSTSCPQVNHAGKT